MSCINQWQLSFIPIHHSVDPMTPTNLRNSWSSLCMDKRSQYWFCYIPDWCNLHSVYITPLKTIDHSAPIHGAISEPYFHGIMLADSNCIKYKNSSSVSKLSFNILVFILESSLGIVIISLVDFTLHHLLLSIIKFNHDVSSCWTVRLVYWYCKSPWCHIAVHRTQYCQI